MGRGWVGMDIHELQRRIARSHDHHFQHTTLRERLRDLQGQVAEIIHHRDATHLAQEIGDAGWSLLQLCTEQGLDFGELVERTLARLDRSAEGKRVALLGCSANPITNGHLTMALEILALTDVHEVWIYLAGEHPW